MPKQRAATLFFAALLLTLTLGVIGTTVSQQRYQSSPEEHSPASADVVPKSVAEMVQYSEAIVIASYHSLSDLGVVTMGAPNPTPTGVNYDPPDPISEFGIVGTNLTVDAIIKNDGNLYTNQTVVHKRSGYIPVTSPQATVDASSEMPIVWPYDTEFILFLNPLPNDSAYYLAFNACGRVIAVTETVGGGVACSDAARTVPAFMSGMSKQQFIDAVATEVSNPSPSDTPYPTDAPTATPTP